VEDMGWGHVGAEWVGRTWGAVKNKWEQNLDTAELCPSTILW